MHRGIGMDGNYGLRTLRKSKKQPRTVPAVYDLDSLLTPREKKLVDKAKADLASKRGNFIPIEELK